MPEQVADRSGAGAGAGGRTVVVGLKLDQQSKELLTWALMKVAQPGDRVIALHVISHTAVLDRDGGSSSLLAMVKTFDSVLSVYEGFCNLKQVDLKLKICRGSSIRKVLVREAKSYFASKVVVGTAKNHVGIGFSFNSVARYCARKLSKGCSVFAVNNGKVVFNRDSTKMSAIVLRDDRPRKNLLSSIHRSLSKNHRVPSSAKCNKNSPKCFNRELENAISCFSQTGLKEKCPICQPTNIFPNNSRTQLGEERSDDGGEANSLALVPLQTLEAASSSVSLLIRELPELRPGCPLVHRAILPNSQSLTKPALKEVSVVQWAMRLPGRHCSATVHPDHQCSSINNNCEKSEDGSSNLDGESGAIVLVGTDLDSFPLSPDRGPSKLSKELESLHEKYASTCRLFGYRELLSATSNFTPENLIGKGGSSKVYKGCLPDGKELAVKILKPSENASKEFVLEIEIITALNHKSIISLFGFCVEDNNLLLVYDFLSRGSLEENLHGNKKDKLTFGWKERYKVALGVAEALDYLHNGSAQPVIHRDVKSSNILLSEDFEPQLSDFGLAKWASTSVPDIPCDDVAGTFGYLAPEYFMYGNVDDKVDVYAFGVVLLELLSGRKPISNEFPKGQESLIMWAKPILNNGKFVQLLDPSLGEDYDNDQMDLMALAATLCIRRSPRSRPQIDLILKLLQGDVEATKWCREQVMSADELDGLQEEESSLPANFQSHLNLALLDVDGDSNSESSSIEQSISVEEYLQGRWSRSSSFD